jgi:tetratricopeptide (TPR) repeat protein
MRTKAGLLLVVVAALLAGYVLRRSPIPAPVSGGEPAQTVAAESRPAKATLLMDPNIILAGVYLEAGQYTAAVTACTLALKLQPNDEYAHYYLGRAYLKMGNMDSAWKEYEALKRLDEELANALMRDGRNSAEQAPQGRANLIDPFALLDKQHETAVSQLARQFDAAEKVLKGNLDLDYNLAMALLKIDHAAAIREGKDPQAMNDTYQKKWLVREAKYRLDLDELAGKRKRALAELEFDRAEKHSRLQTIQTMAGKGQIGPIAAKQAQYHILGVSPPLSPFQLPVMGEDSHTQTDAEAIPAKDQIPKVEAIVTTAGNRFSALIGDDLVSEGATMQGYRVKKIQADSVEFEKEGQTWVQKVD